MKYLPAGAGMYMELMKMTFSTWSVKTGSFTLIAETTHYMALRRVIG